jgi:hypothetical protein
MLSVGTFRIPHSTSVSASKEIAGDKITVLAVSVEVFSTWSVKKNLRVVSIKENLKL